MLVKKYKIIEKRPNTTVLFWNDLPENQQYMNTDRVMETSRWYNFECENPSWPSFDENYIPHEHNGEECTDICICGPFSGYWSPSRLTYIYTVEYKDSDPIRFFENPTEEYLKRMKYNSDNGIIVTTEVVEEEGVFWNH